MDPDVRPRGADHRRPPTNQPAAGLPLPHRCTFAEEVCARAEPRLVEGAGPGHRVACHMNDPASGHGQARLAA
jgi:peptide/nickel transport system ATP-binding protein